MVSNEAPVISETYVIQATQPWMAKSPSGMNVSGINIYGMKIKDVPEGIKEPDLMEYMFLGSKWTIKVGLQLIGFAMRCAVLNFLKK